jgi:hypothetical protein
LEAAPVFHASLFLSFAIPNSPPVLTDAQARAKGVLWQKVWRLENVVAYIYKTRNPGTIPLYRWTCDIFDDDILTIVPSDTVLGCTLDKILDYILPPS